MDKDLEKLMKVLKKGISIQCKIDGSDYVLDRYNIFDAIDLLGTNGAGPKAKEMLDEALVRQLKERVEKTGLDGRILANTGRGITFQPEEVYNKLFAHNLIEFHFNVHDDVEKLKLTPRGIQIYKARQLGM